MVIPIQSLINCDSKLTDASDILYLQNILETTKVLDRLYGRKIAQKYFNSHVCFDTIKLTV